MAVVESDIEIEGGAASRLLVQLVLHDKDNEVEVELLVEDRWVSHGVIALLSNSIKAMVPLEGTCKPEEEEAIRKEMVAEFVQLPQNQRVMFGRKAPRTRAQAAVALEEEQKQSTGSEVLSSIGVHTSGQGMGVSQEGTILGVEEEGESHWSMMGREMNQV
jgi:hypothetical protein